MAISVEDLAGMIDHTLLKAEAQAGQVEALCHEAIEHRFATVCVNGVYVRRAADHIASSGADYRPGVASVIGFPLGAASTASKADEARHAIGDGATELDMVIHVGALLDGNVKAVRDDISAVAMVAHGASPVVSLKVILETGLLTNEQIIQGCRAAAEGEADYVKTSTGMHSCGGATIEHVRLLHRHAAPIKVKASGGIRDARSAIAMIEAGASRIGTSSGVAIKSEFAAL
ncbi:MAG: deoxyribose-phosphate aldolase [Planctomycetota bacterium]|jgi:deoxyribose-phosphate aldolase